MVPDIEEVEIIKKQNNGFLVKNLEHNSTYLISFSTLEECEIEEKN